MRIAITGGAGYIGCRLCTYFVSKGYTVDCIDWLAQGIEPVLNLIDNEKFILQKNTLNVTVAESQNTTQNFTFNEPEKIKK